jgi:uncharacterized protein YbjQ (UPF0145 family)
MLLTTTNSIEGKEITFYLGIVTSHVYTKLIETKGLTFKESFTMKVYENGEVNIENAKKEALDKLKERAKALNATAVIGIHLDVEVIFEGRTLGISAVGTAVKHR